MPAFCNSEALENRGTALWNYVIPHIQSFLRELQLTDDDRHNANSQVERVARSLFAEYDPDQEFNPTPYLPVGSYGRGTAAKSCTDVDICCSFSPMKTADAEKRVSVSYEDPESLRLKCNNIGDHKLAGIMFWNTRAILQRNCYHNRCLFPCKSDERSLYQVISEEPRTV